MMKGSFKKGFQRALRESYEILSSLLNEGMDIHAFRKISDDSVFQRDCDIFASRIQGDKEARIAANLEVLNTYKGNPEGFHEAVQNALKFIENRKNGKASRKAQKIEGVDIVFEDERCLITAPKSMEYSHAAGSILKGDKSCPWCIALPYPKNEEFWKDYLVNLAVYIYHKTDGGALDYCWAMTFTGKNCYDISKGLNQNEIFFGEFQDLRNKGHNREGGYTLYKEMLRRVGVDNSEFYGIIKRYVAQNVKIKYNPLNGKFLRAVNDKNVALAKRFLDMGADVNVREEETDMETASTSTAISMAILNHDYEMLEMLVSRGADVNGKTTFPNILTSPLCFVVYENYGAKFVEILLKCGADVHYHSELPLTFACSNGRLDTVELLVQNGAKVNFKSKYDTKLSDKGDSMLQVAYKNGWDEVVFYLIEHGARVNFKNTYGTTLLRTVIDKSDASFLKRLLKYKPNIENIDKYGTGALEYALECKELRLARILLNAGAKIGNVEQFKLIENKNPASLKFFLKNGGVLDNTEKYLYNRKTKRYERTEYGETPLHICRSIYALDALLETGIDINVTNHAGKTPLSIALEQERYNWTEVEWGLAKAMVKRGADVNAFDGFNGRATILTSCIQRQDVESVKFLIKNGADVNKKTVVGKTALDVAYSLSENSYYKDELIGILKRAGAK